MLRYTEDGIVTEDYIPCRITIFNDSLTIEKPEDKIYDDSLTIEKPEDKIYDESIETIKINENEKLILNIISDNKLVIKL